MECPLADAVRGLRPERRDADWVNSDKSTQGLAGVVRVRCSSRPTEWGLSPGGVVAELRQLRFAAGLDHRAQVPLDLLKFINLAPDPRGALLGPAEDVAHLIEAQAKGAAAPDESQPSDMIAAVEPVAAFSTLYLRDQIDALVTSGSCRCCIRCAAPAHLWGNLTPRAADSLAISLLLSWNLEPLQIRWATGERRGVQNDAAD
jgi:hypothetical protein